MLAALEPTLGAHLTEVFDELLPKQRWREAIPAEHRRRPEVRTAVEAHSPARRHLHDKLTEVFGQEPAGTLMEYLVPAPWTMLDRLGVPVAELRTTPRVA